jgi:HAD superfamily hydrolase (TIGR01458 family)
MRGILFDLDGVLYNAEEPIAGAANTVEWARRESIPHLFVTNTTSHSRAELTTKFSRLGIPGSEDQILTPCVATAGWLRGEQPEALALFVPPLARSEFEEFAVLDDAAASGASHVIVGDLGEAWDFKTLNRAFRLLHSNAEAKLVALGMTRYWQSPDGPALDVAPFVVALEHATGREAVVMGKPSKPFFEAAISRLGLAAGRVLMIGDDIEGDVGGAQNAGLVGALVRTGKFQPADLDGGIAPDAVFDSVADLPRWWPANS